jgi:GNAT superfamily N-acetyltransferase
VSYDGAIVRIGPERLEEAGAMLGRAFFDNPMALYLFPDASQRLGPLSWTLGTFDRYCLLCGEVHTTSDRVDGTAAWLAPDSPPMSGETITAAGMTELPDRMGSEPFQRLMAMKAHFDALHERDAPEPHWYLWTLGVDPPRQGQGIGGALMQPVFAQADAEGLPCYLEADKAKNVPFYQMHGFEVVEEGDIPGGGMHYWTMKREPRRPKAD